MKKTFLLLVAIGLFSCKTKTVTVEKSIEKEKEYLSRYFDSLFQQSVKMQLDWQKKQSSITDNLKLSSFTELDSSGNRKPFHYKHYLNGELKEEIYLEGGEINKETVSNKSDSVEHKKEHTQEKTRIDVDVGQKKAAEKLKIDKAKKADVKGFQFGFYLWLFLIVVVLIVLNWISKKIKLPDKIKALLGDKGG
jgi:hypothetical protein